MSEQHQSREEIRNAEFQAYYDAMRQWGLKELMDITKTETNQDCVEAAWKIIEEREQEDK